MRRCCAAEDPVIVSEEPPITVQSSPSVVDAAQFAEAGIVNAPSSLREEPSAKAVPVTPPAKRTLPPSISTGLLSENP